MIFKPHDRSDHAVYVANPESLDLCMVACLNGRKDQNPVEPCGQAVKQRDVGLYSGPVECR
jgi:hypothetical protein